MIVEILKTEVADKGKYKACVVSYKEDSGKVGQKNLVSFGDYANVFKTIAAAAPGATFDIALKKNDKGYWDWTAAEPAAAGAKPAAAAATASVRSSYETPAERAARQVYIVKQSSITAAVNVLCHNNPKTVVTPEQVIELADKFVGYVFSSDPAPVAELPEVAI